MWRVFSNRAVARTVVRRTLLASSALLALPLPAHAAEPLLSVQAAVAAQATGELQSYYTYEAGPLWVGADGTLNPAAEALVQLIETADLDGADPAQLGAVQLKASVLRARQDPSQAALAEAELLLSTALTNYVKAMVPSADDARMIYEHEVL